MALTPATARPVVKIGTVKKLPCPIAADVADQTALHQVVNFYNDTLKDSPEAMAYLEKRRIGHAGAVDQFKTYPDAARMSTPPQKRKLRVQFPHASSQHAAHHVHARFGKKLGPVLG